MSMILPQTAFVVHNALTAASDVPYPEAPLTDNDTVSVAQEINQILLKQKIQSQLFPVDKLQNLEKLKTATVDFIFNCVDDDVGRFPGTMHLVPQIAAAKGIPCSGGTAENILLTSDKLATKKLCLKQAILTPAFWLNRPPCRPMNFFPVIVKPVQADGSEGITQKSVVTDFTQLKLQIKNINQVFLQPALIEKYIDGREISQSLAAARNEPQLFPVAELIFTPQFKPKYKIIDFDNKWRPQSNQCRETKRVCPAKLPVKLARKIKQISAKIWHCFNLQGYARIDYRLDARDRVFLLDVNVNPDITNDKNTGFTAAAQAAGLAYEKLILTMVDSAMYNYCRRQ